MRIRKVLVRWYKSFNYDYELKFAPSSKKKDWQVTGDGWLPHITVSLEHDITAVVGANESGKSHLLDAIHIVLSGEEHSRSDFCRYSTLFSVEKRYCQILWMRLFQATSDPVLAGSTAPASNVVMSVGRSSSFPLWNTAPARTSATRCGALTARQRAWAASISL